MLEELKILIPLLQSAGEGAFWVAVMIIGKDALSILMWPVCIGVAGVFIVRIVRMNVANEDVSFARGFIDELSEKLVAAGYRLEDGRMTYATSKKLVAAIELLGEKEKKE